MYKVLAIQFIVVMIFVISWATNLVKLTDCDFEKDYKCEIVHGIGIIPIASPITVWFETDDD